MKPSLIQKADSTYWMGIATLFVLLFHLGQTNTTSVICKALTFVAGNGDLGVNIFFFLSAYGLCHSYSRCKKTKEFYTRRILRLYPMMIVFMIIHCLFHGYIPSIYSVLGHITGSCLFLKIYCGITCFPDWYIPTLTLYYILFPLLYKLSELLFKLPIWILSTILLVPVLSVIIIHLNITNAILPRIPTFFIGIMTFLAEKDECVEKIQKLFVVFFIYSLTSVVQNSYLFIPFLVYYSARIPYRPFRRFFLFLGRHSLEIYLSQCLFIFEVDYASGFFIVRLLESLVIMGATSFILFFIHDRTAIKIQNALIREK